MTSTDYHTLECFRLQDGRLHVYKYGNASDFLSGYEYFLAKNSLASIINEFCGTSVRIFPAILVNINTGEQWTGYYEIDASQEVSPSTFEDIDSAGYQVWKCDQRYLFVSPLLKDEIIRAGIPDLSFSPGFSNFGG